MTEAHKNSLIPQLTQFVGKSYVITSRTKMQPYCKGFRFGSGEALAVIRPGTLLEIWTVLKACVDADVAIIMQAIRRQLAWPVRDN